MYFEYYILLALLVGTLPWRLRGVACVLSLAAGAVVSSVGALAALGVDFLGGMAFAPAYDSLSALFALIFNFIFVVVAPRAVALTAREDQGHTQNVGVSLHLASIVVLFYALHGILMATTAFRFLFYWELMSVALFLLVNLHSSRREVMHAAVSFFVVMHAGFFVLMGAFAALPPSGHLWGVGAMTFSVWLLFAVGFMLKSAVFPLHFWLPSTYTAAPPWVSALMGGAVTNIGLYGLIRVMNVVGSMQTAAFVLMVCGAAGAIYGAFRLTRNHSLRRLLACSSIENIGLIVLSLGFGYYCKSLGYTELAYLGFLGALLQLVFHAVAKALLYLATAEIINRVHDDRTSALGGLARTMPRTAAYWAAGAFSLVGLLPLAGFFGEFIIFWAFLSGISSVGEPIVGLIGILVVAIVSAVSIFAFAKSYSVAFLGTARTANAAAASEQFGLGSRVAYASMVLVLLLGGFVAWALSDAIGNIFHINTLIYKESMFEGLLGAGVAVFGVILLTVGLLVLRKKLLNGREQRVEPTWACGMGEAPPEAQYTDESFAREVKTTFSLPDTGRPRTRSAVGRRFVPVRIMRRMTGRLAFLQTGLTSHYILHIILFLTLILILSLTGVL